MKFPKRSGAKCNGFLLIEAAVSLAILSLSLAFASIYILSFSQTVSELSLRQEALFNAQNSLDQALANATTTAQTFYLNPCLATITEARSYLGWSATKTISLSQSFFDRDKAAARADDCGGRPSESFWESFIGIETVILPAVLNTIDSRGNVTVVAGKSANQREPNIFSLHMQDSTYTVVASTTLPTTSIQALDAAGNIIYAATEGTTNQLQIMRITDDMLFPISARSLPGVTGSYPSGISIKYSNSKIYVGTHRTAGNEFHVFDVRYPDSPAWLGSIELNHNINAIEVREPYAFLATSGNTSDVIILDVSDPTHIKKVTAVSLLGTEDALSEFLIGQTLYIGRKKSSDPDVPTVLALDISDPESPTISSAWSIPANATSISVSGPNVFINTAKGLYNMQRRAGSTSPPMLVSPISSFSADYQNGTLSFISGNTLTIVHHE